MASGKARKRRRPRLRDDTLPGRGRVTYCPPKMMSCPCASWRERLFMSSSDDTPAVAKTQVSGPCKGSGRKWLWVPALADEKYWDVLLGSCFLVVVSFFFSVWVLHSPLHSHVCPSVFGSRKESCLHFVSRDTREHCTSVPVYRNSLSSSGRVKKCATHLPAQASKRECSLLEAQCW